jgi:hypothetical protein
MFRKNRILFFSLFLFGLSANSFAQTTQPYPFVPHENLHLVVYYNLGPLWVHAGDADLKADTVTYDGVKSIRFTGTGYSLKKYAFIFKLEDYYQSVTTIDGFKPLFYEKKTLEGGYFIHNIYHFHWGRKEVNVHTEATRHPKKDTLLTLNKTFRDVLSATYYLRITNTSALKVGDTLAVPLIVDGKKETYYIVYAGKGEMIRKKDRIACDVYKAVITSSTFFSDTNPLMVFVTSDKNRYPVYVEANIIVGSVKVFMRPYLDFKPKFKAHKR